GPSLKESTMCFYRKFLNDLPSCAVGIAMIIVVLSETKRAYGDASRVWAAVVKQAYVTDSEPSTVYLWIGVRNLTTRPRIVLGELSASFGLLGSSGQSSHIDIDERARCPSTSLRAHLVLAGQTFVELERISVPQMSPLRAGELVEFDVSIAFWS